MPEEQRPVHYVHDVATGETQTIPVSDEEWARIKKSEQEAQAAADAAVQSNDVLKEQVLQRGDPVLTELAKRAGII